MRAGIGTWLRRAAALVPLCAAVVGAGVNAQPAKDASEAAAYRACMERARSDPADGYREAKAWQARDGGAPAEHCLAVAALGLGLYAEAAERLQRLGADAKSGPPALRSRILGQAGNAWVIAGEPNRAESALAAALALAPDDVGLLLDHSIALAGLGRLWEAIDDLNHAAELDPGRFETFLFRATAYRRLGSLELAGDDITRALKIAPANPDALLEHGNLLRLEGDDAGARADWQGVLDAAPDSAAAAAARRNLERLDADGARSSR